MAELVYAYASGAYAARLGSSSLPIPTYADVCYTLPVMKKIYLFFVIFIPLLILYFAYFSPEKKYSRQDLVGGNSVAAMGTKTEEKLSVTHLDTPEPLKALYMTACIASLPERREKMVKLIEDTEANAIVIDVKDYTGVVSFTTGNPLIDKVSLSGSGCRVNDMVEFLEELHQKNIYAIGRVTVFQDPLYVKTYPEVAVKSKKTGGI